MSIILNDNLSIQAPKAADSRFGPYVDTANALTSIVTTNRFQGLVVGITIGGQVVEYWFRDGTTDSNLILKVDNTANTANTVAIAAYVQANTATTIGQASYIQANTANTVAANSYIQANSAYGMANSANVLAKAAFDNSNTKFSSSGGTITGSITVNQDATIQGNLYIMGNTTSINTSSFTVQDSLLILGLGNYTTDSLDIGFASHYNDGVNAHTGLIRDSDTKEWMFFENYIPEVTPNNNIIITDPSFRYANVTANNYKGNVIANNITINGYNVFSYITNAYTQANNEPIGTAAFTRANASFLQANSANTLAANSYIQANSANTLAANSYIQANASFIQANSANTLAANSYIQANAAFIQANSANTLAANSYIQANASFIQANSANTLAANSYIQANASFIQANSANTLAANSYIQANAAFIQANSANTLAANSYIQANAAFTQANSANTLAANSYIQANSANTTAISAYAAANTKLPLVGGTVTGNLIISTTGYIVIQNTQSSISNTSGTITISGAGGIGVGGSIYVGNRVGFSNSTSVSAAYQVYNQAVNGVDTVFG
jgi:hypothetical protein